MKKPDAYIPMVGSKIMGMPSALAGMVGVGIVTLEFALDWWEQARNNRQDGLFYLLKLKERAIRRDPVKANSAKSRNPVVPKKLNTVFLLGGEATLVDGEPR
jgi:hypothetical protein